MSREEVIENLGSSTSPGPSLVVHFTVLELLTADYRGSWSSPQRETPQLNLAIFFSFVDATTQSQCHLDIDRSRLLLQRCTLASFSILA